VGQNGTLDLQGVQYALPEALTLLGGGKLSSTHTSSFAGDGYTGRGWDERGECGCRSTTGVGWKD